MARKRSRHEPLSSVVVDLVAARFRVLGEPIRIRILEALQAGERNVGDLVEDVGSTQPNVSKHLRILQDARLVARRQAGNSVYYSIADTTVFDLCDLVCGSVTAQLAHHARLVEELQARARRR